MVYACFICPASPDSPAAKYFSSLKIDDSKRLKEAQREETFMNLTSRPEFYGWGVHAISPEEISAKMLRKQKCSLNEIAFDATIWLLSQVVTNCSNIDKVFVDTVGPAAAYQAKLQKAFPSLKITVREKADSLYRVVGAASIVAKVLRDRLLAASGFYDEPELSHTTNVLPTTAAHISATTAADISATTAANTSATTTAADISATTTTAQMPATRTANISGPVADISTLTEADMPATTIRDISATTMGDIPATTGAGGYAAITTSMHLEGNMLTALLQESDRHGLIGTDTTVAVHAAKKRQFLSILLTGGVGQFDQEKAKEEEKEEPVGMPAGRSQTLENKKKRRKGVGEQQAPTGAATEAATAGAAAVTGAAAAIATAATGPAIGAPAASAGVAPTAAATGGAPAAARGGVREAGENRRAPEEVVNTAAKGMDGGVPGADAGAGAAVAGSALAVKDHDSFSSSSSSSSSCAAAAGGGAVSDACSGDAACGLMMKKKQQQQRQGNGQDISTELKRKRKEREEQEEKTTEDAGDNCVAASTTTRTERMTAAAAPGAEAKLNAAPAPRNNIQPPTGTGYPSDPTTIAYLRESFHPVFTFGKIVRFSWATVQQLQQQHGVHVEWYDAVDTGDGDTGKKREEAQKGSGLERGEGRGGRVMAPSSSSSSRKQTRITSFFQTKSTKPLLLTSLFSSSSSSTSSSSFSSPFSSSSSSSSFSSSSSSSCTQSV